ncbi:MAG: Gfo/Idh/MocA family oxidoreductase [Pirellulaceae bacterium]|nr:Gfo/Idh/MocA family oxidoreductase [Pirellulaceae bacterium]
MPLVLVVGGGSIGERHLRCFQQVGCEVALCEASDERRMALSRQYGLTRVFAAVEEATKKRWEGVAICTPAHLHVEHALQLAPFTPALLIEKPLCTRIEDAAKLTAGLAGKVVQIAYVLRAHPAVVQARAWLAAGEIGPLREVTVAAGQHFPTFRPAYRQIYYARRETGGGAIQDAATHQFDLIQSLAGRLDWVFCDCAHQQLPDVEVEDTVHLVGRTGGGAVLVSLALNQFMAPNETHVQLHGGRGSIAIRLHEQRAGLFRHGDADWTWTEPLVTERDELFRAQARTFLAAAAGQAPVLCTLDDGLAALRVNLAALQSAERREVVPLAQSVIP